MKACVFTLGCKVNQCESATLIQGFKEKGWEVTDELSFADIYVINTCAVTAEAEKKSRQTIARVRKFNPQAKIVVTGCAAQKQADQFVGKSNVFLITGAKSKDKILSLLDKTGVFIEQKDEYYEEYLPAGSLRTRSYIKVQDGCNNFCSYCIVPYLRGRSRSRDPKNIIDEINLLKPTEAVITGINLSDYNYNGLRLPGLLRLLADFDMRIRLGSLEVGVVDEEFLDATKALRDFAPHFHLSLQSGSDNVLKSMNRKYTAMEYEEKVSLIRKYYPNAAITTDIIVGFSTESIKDFEDTISLVERVKFSDIHCFAYSKREGTKAAQLKELPPEVKKQRLNRLLELKERLKDEYVRSSLGTVQEFIPEEVVDGYVTGYTSNYIRVYTQDCSLECGKSCVVLKKRFKDGAIAARV